MKINRTKFLEKLNIVNKAVSSKSPLYILENIFISVNSQECKLAATNLEISITTGFDYQPELVKEEFETTIPAKLLTSLISTMPDFEIELSYLAETEEVEIRGEKSLQKIKCISSREFPVLPEFEKETFVMDSDIFSQLLDVSFAASEEENRPVLCGVLFENKNKNLLVSAANSFILAKDEFPLVADDFSIIIPAKSLEKIAKEFEDEIQVSITDKNVTFKNNGITSSILLIEGKFPDVSTFWQNIKTYNLQCELNKEEFERGIKQAKIFIDSDDSYQTMSFEITENEITLKTEANQSGNSSIQIPCIANREEQVYLNSQSILDFLKIASEKVIMLMIDNTNPVIFTTENRDEFLFVIMPIHK